MIEFIFVIIVVILTLLSLGFIIKSYPLVSISSIGMMTLGAFVLTNGIEEINDMLTLSIGIMFVCLGFYIFLKSQIENE